MLLGIFKLLNKSQPLDVAVLQQIIVKLDSSLDEVSASLVTLVTVQLLCYIFNLINSKGTAALPDKNNIFVASEISDHFSSCTVR